MKKQLFGIFLGLVGLESAAVLYADGSIVHYDADDYLGYDDPELWSDEEDSSRSTSRRPRIKRPKALPPQEKAMEIKVKKRFSDVLRDFSVKNQPMFQRMLKESLIQIQRELHDDVNDVGYDSRSQVAGQRSKFAKHYQGDKFGAQRAGSSHDNLDGSRDFNDKQDQKDASTEAGSTTDTHESSRWVERAKDAAQNGAQKVWIMGKNAVNNLTGLLKSQGDSPSNSINLLDDDSSSENSVSNKTLSQGNEPVVQELGEAREDWKKILQEKLSRGNDTKNKGRVAHQELKNSKGEKPSDAEIRTFVRELKDQNEITDRIYNDFISNLNAVELLNNNFSGPAHNTRSKNN